MLSSKAKAASELLSRRKAKSDLLAFAQYTYPSYRPAPHHRIIADALMKVELEGNKRLMIVVPPRFGKSELASIRFPAWYLGRNPQGQIIACSYADSLAYSFSRAVRGTIMSDEYANIFPGIDLDRSGEVKWQLANKTNRRSSYIAAGVGSGITGEGADLLIIDDPVKNDEQAQSEAYREKAWNWYTTTARTRLHPGGSIVVIQTRWHEDDLAGRLLAQSAESDEADQWEVIHFSAIDDNGESLWPERYDIKELNQIKATIGTRAFESLYQGNPTVAEGNIIHWDWLTDCVAQPKPNFCVQSWDTAYKTGQDNDFSVCTTWYQDIRGHHCVDMWRGKVEYPELKRVAMQLYQKHNPNVVLIEDKASGQSLIQELRQTTGIPIHPIRVDKDKTTRLNAVAPMFESGNVDFCKFANRDEAYRELCGFPNATHDDIVDSITQYLNYIRSKQANKSLGYAIAR